MRKIAVLALGFILVASFAVPGRAAKPSKWRQASRGVSAYWSDVDWLSESEYRLTDHYSGAWADSFGTFTEYFSSVAVCNVDDDECVLESSISGWGQIDATALSIAKRLRSASLTATIEVQEQDANWEPVGDPYNVALDIDWIAVGKPGRGGGVFNSHGTCWSYHFVSRDRFTDARADGSVGTTDLGETNDGFISQGTWFETTRYC